MGNPATEDTALVLNPKQKGSGMFDCRPQVGRCPRNCNQCFYNRPGAFYCNTDKPYIPDPEEVGDGIVRFNCGHDSNIQKDQVLKFAERYTHAFFNTSIPDLDFPGPVVLTINPEEEEPPKKHPWGFGDGRPPRNLMFVRIRVSTSNIGQVDLMVQEWAGKQVPVVLTFMAYYEDDAVPTKVHPGLGLYISNCYTWKKRHINSYWCATRPFMEAVMKRYAKNHLVHLCGDLDSNSCSECMACAAHYWITRKRLAGS